MLFAPIRYWKELFLKLSFVHESPGGGSHEHADCDSVDLGWCPRFFFLKSFQAVQMLLDSRPHSEEQGYFP